MTTAVVSMAKNEQEMVEGFVRWHASQADFLLIADNGSTDATSEILHGLARDYPLTIVGDTEVAHYQGRKTSALVQRAAAMGADIVIPADQDERWYSPFGRVGDILAGHSKASIFTAVLFDHVPTGLDDDEGEPDPVARIGWRRREAGALEKVAVRPSIPVAVHEGNHGASFDAVTQPGLLVIRHFPLRSVEQMIRKARNGGAVLAATNLPEHIGAHWRQWAQLSDEQLSEVFYGHYFSADPYSDPTLIFDPAPVACPLPS